jgi:hypothetical protein
MKIDELSQILSEFTLEQKDIVERTRCKVHTYQNEINNREIEIKKLNYVIENKENVLK